jgi:hypothetical protein
MAVLMPTDSPNRLWPWATSQYFAASQRYQSAMLLAGWQNPRPEAVMAWNSLAPMVG